VRLASFDIRTVYVCEAKCLKECTRLVPAFSRLYNIKIFRIFEASYRHGGFLVFFFFGFHGRVAEVFFSWDMMSGPLKMRQPHCLERSDTDCPVKRASYFRRTENLSSPVLLQTLIKHWGYGVGRREVYKEFWLVKSLVSS